MAWGCIYLGRNLILEFYMDILYNLNWTQLWLIFQIQLFLTANMISKKGVTNNIIKTKWFNDYFFYIWKKNLIIYGTLFLIHLIQKFNKTLYKTWVKFMEFGCFKIHENKMLILLPYTLYLKKILKLLLLYLLFKENNQYTFLNIKNIL